METKRIQYRGKAKILSPQNKRFKIFDIGGDDRVYSPIRVQWEPAVELNNEGLMLLTDKQRNEIIENVKKELK